MDKQIDKEQLLIFLKRQIIFSTGVCIKQAINNFEDPELKQSEVVDVIRCLDNLQKIEQLAIKELTEFRSKY